MKIIPVINVKTKQDFEEKLRKMRKFKGRFQIDVADGKFTDWKNFQDISEMKKLVAKVPIELHLMIKNPEKTFEDWLTLKPELVYVHYEAVSDWPSLFKAIKNEKTELGLAFTPYTDLSILKQFLKQVKSILLLGVDPGPSGQKFKYHILDKVKDLKQKHPNLKIQVDGGINEEIALELKKVKADEIALGSFLFNNKDPYQVFLNLEKIVK